MLKKNYLKYLFSHKFFFTKYFSQKNIKIFLLYILFFNTSIYGQCTGCGGSTKCGYCGQTQPVCCNSLCTGSPFLLPRSQGSNNAREIVGTQQAIYKYDVHCCNGFLSAALEYQQSFNNQQIPRYFFGQDYVSCKNLYIQGSQVENRNDKAWLADYFGLPTDFSSTISFCPKLQNIILDLNFYAGLDNVTEGLYVKVAMPIAWTKSELCPSEKICNAGQNSAIAGYLSTDTIARENLTTNFLQFMSGDSTFGDMQQPLKYGLITNNKLTKAGLATLRADLGYNFILQPDYHFGVAFVLAAPTGNQPNAKYLFEPIIGNGKHWEVGCELSGSWIFHRCKEDQDKYLGFWIDATMTHLAKNCQCRSLDISCKSNSRYMLLEQMGNNTDQLNTQDLNNNETLSTYQYQKNLIPAINWSTFKLDVEIDLQMDMALKFAIVRNNYSLDIGYNFWGRMGEKFTINSCCACPPCYDKAIKGDAFIYGYYGQTGSQAAIPLGATQSLATIHSGLNYPDVPFGSNPKTNPKIDNPQLAYAGTNQLTSQDNLNYINTSSQSVLIARGELNMDDSPSGVTNKLFVHFNYYKKDNLKDESENGLYGKNGKDSKYAKWAPFIGLGGEVEFATHTCKIPDCNSCNTNSCNNSCNNSCTNSCTNSCSNSCNNSCYLCDFCCDQHCEKRMGISQWGLWLKGGVSFN